MANKRNVVQIIYYTVAPMLTAGSLFFAIGKSSSSASHNPSPHEKRIRVLEMDNVRSQEFRTYIKQELQEIKAAIKALDK